MRLGSRLTALERHEYQGSMRPTSVFCLDADRRVYWDGQLATAWVAGHPVEALPAPWLAAGGVLILVGVDPFATLGLTACPHPVARQARSVILSLTAPELAALKRLRNLGDADIHNLSHRRKGH